MSGGLWDNKTFNENQYCHTLLHAAQVNTTRMLESLQTESSDVQSFFESMNLNSTAFAELGAVMGGLGGDEAELQEARQKASIKWLVTKAYGNSPPREFQEPYYRDHNNRDRLKPHLVHALANAELYCMAMSHLYEDPNYNNLNHWGIIQVMMSPS